MAATVQFRVFCVSTGYLECKAPNIQNYNSAICCMWVQNVVCPIKGRTQADGDGEKMQREILGPERGEMTGGWIK
jgi:hypothetical protein